MFDNYYFEALILKRHSLRKVELLQLIDELMQRKSDIYNQLKIKEKQLECLEKQLKIAVEQQKDLCITSEQLTEQWKKGELQNSGWYYVKCLCENEDRIDYYNASFGCWTSNDKYIKEVLAPVPSYEQWKALNGNMDSVMQTNQALCKKLAQLKELLKECRHIIGIEKDFASCHFEEYTLVELLTKIDEALR